MASGGGLPTIKHRLSRGLKRSEGALNFSTIDLQEWTHTPRIAILPRRLNVSFMRLPQPGHSTVSTPAANRSGMLPPWMIAIEEIAAIRYGLKSNDVSQERGSRPNGPVQPFCVSACVKCSHRSRK